MAAFEAISRITIQPLDSISVIDFRTAKLPLNRPPFDDFDPRDYRDPEKPIKLWMAYFNLLKTVFGAGVLGTPLAISQAGIILGPLIAIATGVLITHTHLLLLKCLNEVSRQLKIPYISYRYGFRLAVLHGPPCLSCIGNCGPAIIAAYMIMSQLGICTVFIAFTSDSLRDHEDRLDLALYHPLTEDRREMVGLEPIVFRLIMDWPNSKMALLTLLPIYLLLEYFMKTLKIVSYISLFGNFMNMIGLTLVLYYIFDDPHGDIIVARWDLLAWLYAFGSFLFNLSAIGVVISLDKALKDPRVLTKRFGMITVGIMLPTIIAALFGGLGYWSFGSMEENILRGLPHDDNLSMVSIGLYLIAVVFAYPIQCYPGTQMVVEVIKNWNKLDTPTDRTLYLIETITRPVFVLTSFFICYLAPFQGPFVAFVGNLCTTFVALVFPALMDICLKYPNDYGKYNIYLMKNLAIITLGLLSATFGVVLCGNLIYIRIMAAKSPNDTEYL